MKVIDALIFTPVVLAVVLGGHLWMSGRTLAADSIDQAGAANVGSAPIDPWLGAAMIGLLVLSGGVLLAREGYAEAQDRKRLKKLNRR